MSWIDRLVGKLLPSLVAENIRLRRRVVTLDDRVLQIEDEYACVMRHTKRTEARMLAAERTLREYGYQRPAPPFRLLEGDRS